MCELLTLAAALAVSALCFRARRAGRPDAALETTALAFWGAALMWAVDCARSWAEGDGLLDLSREDAALGALVLFCGALLYAALRLFARRAPAR